MFPAILNPSQYLTLRSHFAGSPNESKIEQFLKIKTLLSGVQEPKTENFFHRITFLSFSQRSQNPPEFKT